MACGAEGGCQRRDGSAAGLVSARAMASVSTRWAPQRHQHLRHRALAAADAAGQPHGARRAPTRVYQPIHPSTLGRPASITTRPPPARNGPEGHEAAFAQGAAELHHDADDGADDRRHQHDRQDGLPAQPGAQRGQQLEVAKAHAFLAGGQLEQPVDRPQRQIAGDRPTDRFQQGPRQSSPAPLPPDRPTAAAASGASGSTVVSQSISASASSTGGHAHHSRPRGLGAEAPGDGRTAAPVPVPPAGSAPRCGCLQAEQRPRRPAS
jgi:hypothetical protein